jgi:hypothetical protein
MHQRNIPWTSPVKMTILFINGKYPVRQYDILFKKPRSCKHIYDNFLDTSSIPVQKVQFSLFAGVLTHPFFL